MSSLSRRGRQINDFPDLLSEFFVKSSNNEYDKATNPEGIIKLGTSENKLMFDLLSQKFEESVPHSIIEKYTHYCPDHGLKSFREAMAEFFNYYMKPIEPVEFENLVVMNGCGPVIEALGAAIADPGEGILIPAPFYGGFATDLQLRAGVIPFPVDLSGKPNDSASRPFELSVASLENALEKARKQGIIIRGLLLCNPNNPLGEVYSEELTQSCMQFAARHSLHIISDEIYMLSIFKEGFSMKCALSFKDIPDREHLHVVWGFSKDFGVSGFRCGVLHTWNKDVFNAVRLQARFHVVSPPIQHVLMHLIKDKDWLDNVYIPIYHKRLREAHKILCDCLRDSGIPFLDRESGLYVWANFQELMSSPSFSEELALCERFLDDGVYISPGQAFFCSEPGWFRLVFSTDQNQLKVATTRLCASIRKARNEIGTKKANKSGLLSEVSGESQSGACAGNDACANGTLEDLVRSLSDKIHSNDWLQQNTAEKWVTENPDLAKAFMNERSGNNASQ